MGHLLASLLAAGCLVAGCVGPTVRPIPPLASQAVSPAPSRQAAASHADAPSKPASSAEGLTWSSETDAGWVTGVVGGPTRLLQRAGHATVVARGPGQIVFVFPSQRGVPISLSTLDLATGAETERIRLSEPELGLRIVSPPTGDIAYFHSWADQLDFGLRRLDLTSDVVTQVVEGGPSGQAHRTALALSPDGQTVASALCDHGACSIDLVALTSGKTSRLEDRQLLGVGDDWVLLAAEGTSGLIVRRIDDGEERTIAPWEVSERNPVGASVEALVALSRDRFVLARTSFGHYDLTLIDAMTGSESLLWRDPAPGEVPALTLVSSMRPVGNSVWLADAAGPRPGGTISALDVTDGSIEAVGAWSYFAN